MDERVPIRSAWNESLLILKGPLTDRAIAGYQRRGWYSREMKEARKARAAEKAARRQRAQQRREGNFLIGKAGQAVYSPV
jgi:hypothetical protein